LYFPPLLYGYRRGESRLFPTISIQERINILMLNDTYKILSTVLEAGNLVYSIYHSDFSVSYKGKDDPLTQADIQANLLLSNFLKQQYPQDAIISEEASKHAGTNDRQWVIDPIDGTREFVSKNPQFAISLGLLEKSVPTLGVIFNPANGELFYGIVGKGVLYQVLEYPYTVKDVKFDFSQTVFIEKEKYSCCVSISETKTGVFDGASVIMKNYSVVPVGSIAYKLGLVSVAKFDLTFSVFDKNNWDVCAGIAIVLAAGGRCIELETFTDVVFKNDDPIHGLLAGNPLAIKTVILDDTEMYKKMYRLRN
jgi:fructose-1,6-bisphosphatase/inositol monophosphatase family enzyme